MVLRGMRSFDLKPAVLDVPFMKTENLSPAGRFLIKVKKEIRASAYQTRRFDDDDDDDDEMFL